MAFNVQQLVKILGKNADDFAKIGKKGSAGYNKALNELTEEFNKRGSAVAQWTGAGDFASLNQSQQMSLVNKYNAEFTKRGNKAAKWSYAGDFSSLNQSEQVALINRYDSHMNNMSAGKNRTVDKSIGQDIADARRHRREQIRSGGKSEAARTKAAEDLKRPVHEEAQNIDRSTTREQYKQQQSEARKKKRSFNEQDDGQYSLFDMDTPKTNTTDEYIARKTTGFDGKEHTVYDKNNNYKPEQKYKEKEITGLDGEKYTVYSEAKPVNTQTQGQDTIQVNRKTNEIDTKTNIERQAREARINEVNNIVGANNNNMKHRSLGTWVEELISGTGDETHRFSGRNTRRANMEKANIEINTANQRFIDTGEGKDKVRGFYDKNSYWAEVKGKGKKQPANNTFNQNDWSDITDAASQAENVAGQNSKKGFNFDGIAKFMKENQLITAAGIAGTAFIGAELLDEE